MSDQMKRYSARFVFRLFIISLTLFYVCEFICRFLAAVSEVSQTCFLHQSSFLLNTLEIFQPSSKYFLKNLHTHQFLLNDVTLLLYFQSYISFSVESSPFKVDPPLLPSVIGLPPTDDVSGSRGDVGRSAATAAAARRREERGTSNSPSAKTNKNKQKRKTKTGQPQLPSYQSSVCSEFLLHAYFFEGPSYYKEPNHDPDTSFSMGDTKVDMTSNHHLGADPTSLYPVWSKATSSDSEWSDVELGGSASKTRSLHTRVRQSTLGCFHALVKVLLRPPFNLYNT